jgi:hypothetical protein
MIRALPTGDRRSPGSPGGRPIVRALLTAVAGLSAVVALGAGCGEEDKPPPDVEDVDRITASVSKIAFHCRSVEQGFLASVDEEALRRDVDPLLDAAEDLDPGVTFRLPEPAIKPETTLRDQVELAARLLGEGCSPEDAERLRDALPE